MIDRLTEIALAVQERTHFQFDLLDVSAILAHTLRKVELNQKDPEYIPVLFENELEDFVMRMKLNLRGESILCA